MSAPLRTDSDLKAALVCSGHANIVRDMRSKCELQMLYLQMVYAKLQSYSSNGEWRKKEFFNYNG